MDKYYIIDVLEYDDICEETYTGVYTEDDVVLIFRTKQDAIDKMKAIVAEQETWAEGNPYNVEWGDDYVDYDVNGFGITSRRMEIVEAKIV
jgi:hypothetical protein